MNKKLMFGLGGLFCSLLLLVSCVTTQEDLLYVNRQIAALSQKVDKMDQRIGGELDSIRESQADTGSEMDRLKQEIQEVKGRLADNRQLVRRAVERDTTEQDRMKRRVADLTRRMTELESRVAQISQYLNLEGVGAAAPAGGTSVAPVAGPPAPAAGAAPEKSGVPADRALYEATLALYKDGKYNAALSGFKAFIKKYPRSELADNAQFWAGECHMALKQFEQAILAYQRVIKTYPSGNKVPNAMLRQALAFYQINDKTSCRLLLKRIIKKYPRSNEARIARAKLKTIK